METMARKQKEKSQQTARELMDSAIEIFGRKGFAQATIAEITDNAGYAKGNFYRYWRSKDDVFLDIMERRLREYRSTRREGLEKAKNVQDVMNVIVDFLETIVDDENWSRVFLEFTMHAFGNDELKSKLNESNYRLSSHLFADIFAPFVEDRQGTQKLGALVTALFEGFLIQQALETRVLSKSDLRQAVLLLCASFLDPSDEAAKPQPSRAKGALP
jgi:AcrR family transcriptional regulator